MTKECVFDAINQIGILKRLKAELKKGLKLNFYLVDREWLYKAEEGRMNI